MASLLELMEEQENKNKLSEEIISSEEQTEYDTSLTVESLEAIIEMVEHNSLDLDEKTELMESIEEIFNNILDEAVVFDEMECDDDESGCNECGDCTDKDELDSHDGICDTCYDEKDVDELSEATLKKTSAKKRKASKRYARSAAGKKSKKIAAKKRKKYALKITRCSGKGKTFSFKKMTCVKPKKRR